MLKILYSKYYWYFSFSLLLFIVVPGFFIGQNINNLLHLNSTIFISTLVFFFFVSTITLILFDNLLSKYNKDEYLFLIVRLALFYVLLAGLFFPASQVGWVGSIYDTPIDYFNITVIFFLVVILHLLTKTKYKEILYIVISVNIFINFFMAAESFLSFIDRENSQPVSSSGDLNKKSIYNVSSNEKNIFVYSLDGVSRDLFIKIVEENVEYSNKFKDFLFYKHVTGPAPATYASISDELYGNQNFKDSVVNETELRYFNPKMLITNLLNYKGYNVSTYGSYSMGFYNENNAFDRGAIIEEVNPMSSIIHIHNTYDYILARLFTRNLVNIKALVLDYLNFNNYLNNFVLSLYPENMENRELYNKMSKASIAGEHFLKGMDIIDNNNYLKHLSVVDSQSPSAHFLHNGITHWPISINGKCEYMGHDKKWINSMQSPEGNRETVLCAIKSMISFIDKLKEIGAYDNSLIVLKSDHGKPQYFYDERSIESFKTNGNDHFGYSRYTPVLLIKDFNRNFSEIEFDYNPVIMGDLAKTLCINSDISFDCNLYPGFNILEENLNLPESALAHYFVVEDRESTYRFEDLITITMNRSKDFYNDINNILVDKFINSPISCEDQTLLTSREKFQNGFTDGKSWAWWRDYGKLGLRTNIGSCSKGVNLFFYYDGMEEITKDIKLSINGNNLSANIEKMKAFVGKDYYRVIIKKDYLNDKGNEFIELGTRINNLEGQFHFIEITGSEG